MRIVGITGLLSSCLEVMTTRAIVFLVQDELADSSGVVVGCRDEPAGMGDLPMDMRALSRLSSVVRVSSCAVGASVGRVLRYLLREQVSKRPEEGDAGY